MLRWNMRTMNHGKWTQIPMWCQYTYLVQYLSWSEWSPIVLKLGSCQERRHHLIPRSQESRGPNFLSFPGLFESFEHVHKLVVSKDWMVSTGFDGFLELFWNLFGFDSELFFDRPAHWREALPNVSPQRGRAELVGQARAFAAWLCKSGDRSL